MLYIGLMSGTSLDGVDAALGRFGADGSMQVLAHRHQPFPDTLRSELLALNSPGSNELHRAALAANGVARSYASLVGELLSQSGHHAADISALGAHGQTVRHRPGEFDGCGYTSQLLNGALLAELSGIAVVCDFRSRDLAAGGQGAPLVPAFHQALFGRSDADVAVLNIGGISNLSLLHGDGRIGGFDCGPGNCLMDLWIARHQGLAYDAAGAWAAQGQVLPALLAAMLAEPYFRQAPPRSTGRDLFNERWLDALLAQHASDAAAVDVQATLLQLSAQCCASSLLQYGGAAAAELLVCGGGALNTRLMAALQALLPGRAVLATDARGLPAMQVEAAAFAWLAHRFMQHQPGNLASVTGARGARVLGALYPA
ncbi:anhydro-N-acetylmuramic acid kinase [Paucibacter soli]|uniref:anhydro-N-acetylmuramic acid kinase n=1 Tax=Paucibacter soli TaxID=3133433 RepID=UPI0030ACDC95